MSLSCPLLLLSFLEENGLESLFESPLFNPKHTHCSFFFTATYLLRFSN